MADIPSGMLADGRLADQHFEDAERLYRRFEPDNLDGNEISIAAVALPDMSVVRSKYGQAEWLLRDEEYANWGVLRFLVRDIPPNRDVFHYGVIAFRMEPRHVPYQKNYPHSEVWVHCDGTHICRANNNVDLLDPDFHLRWRECIVLASQVVVRPTANS